jgi:hypothetical protein
MSLLEAPRCPVCYQRVNAQDVRREVLRRKEWPAYPPWGIRCPGCRTELGIRRWPVFVAGAFLLLTLGLASQWLLARAKAVHEDLGMLAAFALVIAFVLAYTRWAPLFAQLRRPGPTEHLRIEKTIAEKLAADADYQEEVAEVDERNEWIEEASREARGPWRCSACREENPGNFDVCWNCEKARGLTR